MNHESLSAKLLTISQFLRLSRLSAEQMLNLLECGKIPFVCGVNKELLVDINTLDPQVLAIRPSKMPSFAEEQSRSQLEESIAAEIIATLDPLLEEALSLAIQWRERDKCKHSKAEPK